MLETMILKRNFVFFYVMVMPKLLNGLKTPVRTGLFQILKKHPNIKACAQKALQKDEYLGGRVHELTGYCELLNNSVGNNKTCDKGFAYVERLCFEKRFYPPVLPLVPIDLPDLMNPNTDISFVADLGTLYTEIEFTDTEEKSVSMTVHRDMGVGINGNLNEQTNACNLNSEVSSEKALFALKYQTNTSMEIIVDNKVHCKFYAFVGNVGRLKQMRVTTKVHSMIYS